MYDVLLWMSETILSIGMVAWLKEYVVRRAIPIRNLLLGLGVLLVRRSPTVPSLGHLYRSCSQSQSAKEADDQALLQILKVALTRMYVHRFLFFPSE